MMRIIARVVLALLANALGIYVADLILTDMKVVYPGGLLIPVAIFTVIVIVVQPLIVKMTLTGSAALAGSSALAATFIGLLITTLISSDLSITGVVTWILATVIVWGIAIIGTLLLPFVLFKKTMAAAKGRSTRPAV